MPRIVKTTLLHAEKLINAADCDDLRSALFVIAESALDDAESGADTASLVYEELSHLGIIVP
jgi:hypothetical protein